MGRGDLGMLGGQGTPTAIWCRKRRRAAHAPSEHAHWRAHVWQPARPPRAPPYLAGLRSSPTPAARRWCPPPRTLHLRPLGHGQGRRVVRTDTRRRLGT